MYLQQKLVRLLSKEHSTEAQLLAALRQLLAQYDCDRDFYSNPTLDIPPPDYVRPLEPEPAALRAAEPELNLIYG